MKDDPRDYCKHGAYVGGCGIDWMCFDCEMGILDQAPRRIKAQIDEFNKRFINVATFITEQGCKIPSDLIERCSFRIENLTSYHQLAEHWADDEDDTDWLGKKHRAEIDAWWRGLRSECCDQRPGDLHDDCDRRGIVTWDQCVPDRQPTEVDEIREFGEVRP